MARERPDEVALAVGGTFSGQPAGMPSKGAIYPHSDTTYLWPSYGALFVRPYVG